MHIFRISVDIGLHRFFYNIFLLITAERALTQYLKSWKILLFVRVKKIDRSAALKTCIKIFTEWLKVRSLKEHLNSNNTYHVY